MNKEDEIAEEDGSGKVTDSSSTSQTTQTTENTQDTIVIDPGSQVETQGESQESKIEISAKPVTNDSSGIDKTSTLIILVSWTVFIVLAIVFLVMCIYYRKRNNARGNLNISPSIHKLEKKDQTENTRHNREDSSVESCL